MVRNFRYPMMLLAVLAAGACGGHGSRTAPEDPIQAVAPSPVPVGSLAGTNVLLLTAGGIVFGDSVAALDTQQTALLDAANAALDTALRRDAREVTWLGIAEQRRMIRRNPTFDINPDRLPTAFLLSTRAAQVPDPLWADIRTLAALGNARFALVPAAVRITGAPDAYAAVLVMAIVDARTGVVLWRGRTDGPRAASPAAALARAASALVPSLLQPAAPRP